jgi:two-component sensor histidine kinase
MKMALRWCKTGAANGLRSIKKVSMVADGILEQARLVQTTVLALSIFNLVTFLWLALTVWLNGDRRKLIARVGIAGLALSAFFFFLHAMLIAGFPQQVSSSDAQEFLWHLIWIPALGVPYIWFVIGLHYASLINERWRRRRPLLLTLSAIMGCSILLLLILNRSTFTFSGTIRLLSSSDMDNDHNIAETLQLVLLPVLFLCYLTFCAIGPWFTPGKIARLLRVLWQTWTGRNRNNAPFRQRISDAFWDDATAVEALEEPVLSWHLARPGLLVAALLMVALTTSLGVLGVWSMLHWLATRTHSSLTTTQLPTLDAIPLQLLLLDLFSIGAVALIILLIGYSVVRHGILIERPLARRGFLEQWRGIVIVATAVAVFIALLTALTESDSLSGLLVITSLATVAYALFTWSSYTAHDRYIALLGPFLQSTNVRHWLNTDLQKTERSMEDLFFHLCQDVLEVRCARLELLSGPIRRNFSYRWPHLPTPGEPKETPQTGALLAAGSKQSTEKTPPGWSLGMAATRTRMMIQDQPMICWILPIYDELGLVAKLYLGPRQDGGVFTDEDMQLAHACGQRILDTLRDHEAMQAVAGLLRRRIVDVKLLGAQHRRVLHDEILPQMHLALLRLERLTPVVAAREREATGIAEATMGVSAASTAPAVAALQEAIEQISDAHRRLAAMMRTTTPSAPHRLERDGLMHAIHAMIAQDFQQAFDEVEWDIAEETMHRIDEMIPPALAEITFAAVQETLRNAARHGRGSDIHRRLRLTLRASLNPDLEVVVADDGVGILSASSTTTGTGGGLLTHSALLAIAGGSLTVKSAPDEGVTVRILLPAEALRPY